MHAISVSEAIVRLREDSVKWYIIPTTSSGRNMSAIISQNIRRAVLEYPAIEQQTNGIYWSGKESPDFQPRRRAYRESFNGASLVKIVLARRYSTAKRPPRDIANPNVRSWNSCSWSTFLRDNNHRPTVIV